MGINSEKLENLKTIQKGIGKLLSPVYVDALDYAVRTLESAYTIEKAAAEQK